MSFDLLQVFVELGNLHRTSNYDLYLIHRDAGSDSVNHNRVQVLRIPVLLLACSQDLTYNLRMIVSLEALETNAYNHNGLISTMHDFLKHLKKSCENNNEDEDKCHLRNLDK